MTADATQRQNRASRPESSTWVSANAGSGKTRVLTDRVARLLLNKNDPQKILCLTYTKAAAAEMQNRLFQRLGKWAMLDDAGLRKALSDIGEKGDNYNDAALKRTRTHFARALETPGGLKIQTIHAFCASLLRRFPIEAGVSPQFREMEDGQARLLRASILDEMARGEDTSAFDALARNLTNEDALDRLLMDILKNRSLFPSFDRTKLAAILEIDPNETESDIVKETLSSISHDLIKSLGEALVKSTTKGETERNAGHQLKALSDQVNDEDRLNALTTIFLTQEMKPRAAKGFPSKSVLDQAEWIGDAMADIKDAIFSGRQKILTVRAIARAQDLRAFATRFIERYEAAKSAQNLLDFDDLINRTRALLSSNEMTQWVLYRIDNGIDHILVDEAQDTSPAQWDIVESLSKEFTDGEGASSVERTLFVVGDKKQSIFGFQGADPEEFHVKQDLFSDRFDKAGKKLESIQLPTSFRSAPPILKLVDQVFSNDMGALGGAPVHEALEKTPGRIELWPFEAKDKAADKPNWWEPVDTVPRSDPVQKLAIKIANHIAGLITSQTPLHTKEGTRAVRPGDFLILVRSRSRFFHVLIDQLKKNAVPVAGADRMKIGEQLAVRDLISLLKFLDNELDDLSLAETLRSPIFGLTESDLFHVAHGRDGTLWQSLRKSSHDQAVAILDDLRKQSDFIRPFELLTRVLTHHGARLNFKARLGDECEDAIDELLAQSITFETSESPTLGRFLFWLSARDIEIKRDMEAGHDQVRVMTVHGAKGLEAPIVIIPDTSVQMSGNKKPPIASISGQVFWTQNKVNEPQILLDVDDARQTADAYEYARLLYVALTRAENWLIFAGAGKSSSDSDNWYNRVTSAMQKLGATDNEGVLSVSHQWEGDIVNELTPPEQVHLIEPWLSENPDAYAQPHDIVSPSKFDGPHALPGEYIEDGTIRGDLIHKMLEVLPTQAHKMWDKLASQICGEAMDHKELLLEVEAVMQNPAFAEIFSSDTLVEVPITARLDELNGQIINGRIDRLLINSDRVLAVDFKSNLKIPNKVTEIPKAILAQQGAYAAALTQMFPDRSVETAILWTRTGHLMMLPHALVIKALSTVTSS